MIPEDIIDSVGDAFIAETVTARTREDLAKLTGVAGRLVLAERTRCLTIIQSIETTSAQGMRVIDEIARKVRGDE